MNKKRLRVAKKSPMFEKKVIFGIRKFTVGVASVGIATAFLISGTGQLVQAEEVATPSTEITAPINTDQTSDVDATASVAGSELVEEVVTSDTTATEASTLVAEAGEVLDAQVDTASVENVATSDTTATEASTLVAEAGEVFDAQVNTASVEEVVTSDTTAAEASTLVAEAGEAFDAQVNTASVENVATVAVTATSSTPADAPLEEGSIRLHFENVDETAPESQGLWTWGGVAEPSDGSQWPTDTVNFSSSQVDDYGHYVDIKKSETPGTIGYVVLKDGEKITESDQKVELLVPEQNEAWVASDYTVSSYEPLKDENVLRINYKREDNDYDGWGVWTWGDTTEVSSGWPVGALDFKVGKYGAYVDIPLSNGLDSKLGFLLINQNNPDLAGNKSVDFAFADRKRHSQIFLRNGDDKVYTNPYFIEEKVELDTSKATPGTKNKYKRAFQLQRKWSCFCSYNQS